MNPTQPLILIYDGHCSFCAAQAERLKRLAGSGRIRLESFQEPGVLARFPALTYEECMKEIKLAAGEGKIFGGAEAIFYALSLNPFYRPLKWLYQCPILKPIFDLGYKLVSQNRYKIQTHECPSGTCPRHGKKS